MLAALTSFSLSPLTARLGKEEREETVKRKERKIGPVSTPSAISLLLVIVTEKNRQAVGILWRHHLLSS